MSPVTEAHTMFGNFKREATEARQLLGNADDRFLDEPVRARLLAEAQVHATLAAGFATLAASRYSKDKLL